MLRFALIAIVVLQVRVALADADSAREPKPQLGYGRYTLMTDLGALGIVASGAAFSGHAEWFVGAGLTFAFTASSSLEIVEACGYLYVGSRVPNVICAGARRMSRCKVGRCVDPLGARLLCY